ncbi:MAG: LysM peptidoglycan-binding domain-containing protein [Campylobacter sp.]|nr:LysM peptidoglycan-binding domain-containing protein [Campylobacter sp.]
MQGLKYLLFMILTACFAVANPIISNINHEKVLKDFEIENNLTNKMLVYSIYKDIPKQDRDLFRHIIKTKTHHAHLIKSELDELEAPEFLLYLAMIESHLSNKATSGAKAAGIWQFMPTTARNFGLRVDKFVDERRDPRASTEAAFAYLAFLKKNMGKWYLALMAYNCGEGRLKKAIAKTGSDDLEALMSSGNLPKETKGFIKKIIRYSYIATSSDVRKMLEFENKPMAFKRISVSPGTKLSSVAKSIGISVADLTNYNAHIKQGGAPLNGRYYFYIPEKKYSLFVANFNAKGKQKLSVPNENYQNYTVSAGDSLSSIAKQTGVSIKDLKIANNLKTDKILLNQTIKIPSSNVATLNVKKYIVKNGDTLAGISKMFSVNINDLVAINDIKDGKIVVGDNIDIP